MNDLNNTISLSQSAGVSAHSAEAPKSTLPPRPVEAATAGKTAPPSGQQNAEVREKQPREVEQAVGELNNYVQSIQRKLKFTLDSDLGKPVVTVLDQETSEIIRQMPTEVALKLARNLKDIADQSAVVTQSSSTPNSKGGSNPLPLINTKI